MATSAPIRRTAHSILPALLLSFWRAPDAAANEAADRAERAALVVADASANRPVAAGPSLLALVPDHVGQTLRSQPSLFWHIDRLPRSPARIVFTLALEDGVEPLVESDLPPLAAPGLQRIRLGDLGASLEPEQIYVWSVALVVDPARRSRDVLDSGYIQRVTDPVGGSAGAGSASALAAKGLWYDALEAICNQVDAAPGDAHLRAERNTLLRQAGLFAAVEGAD